MKAQITINITLDTETAYIEAMDIVEGIYNRLEIVADGSDRPISINKAVRIIDQELGDYLE